MHQPREEHWQAALRVVRYLKGRPGQGVLLRRENDFILHVWCDSDWAGCPLTRRSLTGWAILLGNSLISWKTKKQHTVSRSSAEAEYRSMANTTCELKWLKKLLLSLGISHTQPIPLSCDSQAALHIAKNPVFHERTKNIEVDCHLVRDAVIQGLILPSYVPTKSQQFGKEGWRPDEVTVIEALSACSQLGAVRQGEIVHRYIVDEKLDMNGIVCNAAIDMYRKCDFVDKAYLVFNKMSCKNTLITWNTMIMAFAMNGDGYKALDLLDQMVLEGMLPDDVSYLSALCACNHAGLVEEGVRLLDTMIECGVKPNVKYYGTVVDLLGRAGRLQEAYDIINSMPMMPDIVFWQTLLGASKTYGNVEMAEIASKKLVEMGSNASGDIVLLSNVQRWHDVGRVRETMKNSDVKKVPGFSYTEIDDNSKEIYMKLDEIRFKIKAYGYDAETNLVLHDIGDEDKENVLNFHSEKLAVAYSLISTRDGTPIHVIKNLLEYV
ncbi:pentatricopeptide repeat-containing protein At1g34160-like [Arachis hypogaea]|uniref:pentatricopeptide repeat-containing protein At1g34160-like n=1 Tax=Arachis hypogaea TaxID=3818 RepID=UPI000DED005C|nr:pentatricopeptide repeat-containing protein At1g34160-like [Arachis hypogaea]